MGNEIENFKEKINAIPIPEDQLNSAITGSISSAKKRPRKVSYVIAVAATLMVILFGSAFVSPAMAKIFSQVPLVGSVLSYFDTGLEQASNEGLVTSVGETFVDRDIPITITEVYYDNFRLVVGYSIPIQEQMDDYKALETEIKMRVDDQIVTGMNTHSTVKDDLVLGTIETNVRLPESFTLDISFSEVFNKIGDWSFQLPVRKNTDALVYDVTKTKEMDAYTFEVVDVQLAPSGTKIHMKLDTPMSEDTTYDFLVYNHNGEKLELLEEDKKTIPLVNFEKDVVKTSALYEPSEDHVFTIIPALYDDGKLIEMKKLAIVVDLSTVKGKEISNEAANYGLIDDKVDQETFLRNYMVEEIGSELGIELGEYSKAEVTVLSLEFASDFQKEQKINKKNVVKTTALIEESSNANAYVVYKTEDGINHIFEAEKVRDKWKITDSYTFEGKTIVDLEMLYDNQ
ncbi:DUF4179 domain-containing protein [Ornithinibacillus salinisoli]|uniref:DUF4179 domain-containing protein n=1 Tax=Ornithinibacillus salinisoli TaxID=1848459 RepID=A0ABW4VZ37_9BACI